MEPITRQLDELCPRCGADWLDDERGCAAFGVEHLDSGLARVQRPVTPMGIALISAAGLALAAVSFGAGYALRPATPQPSASASAPAPVVSDLPAAATGRVLFAERLVDDLDLESYRSVFTADQTIAWRLELAEPPSADHLTMVLAWYSARETMVLSRTPVPVLDPQLTVIGRDEVAIADLVPTAGVYSVSYFAGDTKLAEGTFELLPRTP